MDIEIVGSSRAAKCNWVSEGPVFVMPFIDAAQALRTSSLMGERAGAKGLLLAVHDDLREGFVAIANHIFQHTESPTFGYVAQDAFPGRRWLKHALAALDNAATKLLAFNDGKWFGALAAYGLVRRDWASKLYQGKLFHPGYRRHYADTELSVLAIAEGALGYAADALLIEVDWDKESQSVEDEDRRLFHERSRSGFDGRVASPALRDLFS